MFKFQIDPKINISSIVGWVLLVGGLGITWGVTRSELNWQRRDIDSLRIFVEEQTRLNTKFAETEASVLTMLHILQDDRKIIRSPRDEGTIIK